MTFLSYRNTNFTLNLKITKLPHYLQNLPLNGNINAHSHATRTQNNIGQMKPIHEYARKYIRYKVPITINNAPAEIVNKVCKVYNGYIKTKILQLYQKTFTIAECCICSRN